MNNTKIELYENENQIINAAIDKIAVEIINKKNDFSQTIVMTGCSPLAGTTSISISLAIALATTGRKTLLIDGDVRKSSQYKKSNDNAKEGLANLLLNNVCDDNTIKSFVYETNVNNLHFVPCGQTDENPTRVLCSEKMDDFLRYVRQEYECVIFDFPSFSVVPDVQIMFGKCDGVILVSALGETTKAQIKDAYRMIETVLLDKYYGMIINKVSLDIYKKNVIDYDYYLLDKNGKQKFEKNNAYKKHIISARKGR